MGSSPTLRNLFWRLTWTTLQLFSETIVLFNWFLYLILSETTTDLKFHESTLNDLSVVLEFNASFCQLLAKPFSPNKLSQSKQLPYRTLRTAKVIKEFKVLFCQCYFQVRRVIRSSKKSATKTISLTVHWHEVQQKAEFNGPFSQFRVSNWKFGRGDIVRDLFFLTKTR